jgi:hypothetical protein
MRHSLIAQGYGIRLRPVRLEDAPFIVWLRNLGHVKGRLGDSAQDIETQRCWLNNYFERDGDYYLLLETVNGTALGTLAFYDVIENRAEIGRVVMRPGVPALVPASVLFLDLIYGRMGITQIHAAVVAGNTAVHSYLGKGCFRKVKLEPASIIIGEQTVELTHFVQDSEDWNRTRERGVIAAERGASAIRQWERSYLAGESQQLKAEA